MTTRRLVVLLVLAMLVIAGAIWLSLQRNLPRDTPETYRVLPDLASTLNDITQVQVIKAGEVPVVTLKRTDAGWQVEERTSYSADAAKLRKLLIDLSELKVVEDKTASPAHYAQLGVEDLKDANASGVRVNLTGAKEPQSLIIGKTAGTHSTYVRVAGQPKSLLATPQLIVESDPRNWLNRNLLDIPAAGVQEARVRTASGSSYIATRMTREQTDFTVPNLPKGRSLASPTAANSTSSALVALSLEDVRRVAPEEDWSKGTAQAEFRMFDGTVVVLTGRAADDKHWVRIAVSFDDPLNQRFALPAAPPKPDAPPAAKEPVAATKPAAPTPAAAPQPDPAEIRAADEKLTRKFDGWAYEIPAFKYESIFRPLDQLLKGP